jgi:hypothetical protein
VRQSWFSLCQCPLHSVPVLLIQEFCCLVLPHAPPEFDCCLINGNSTVSQAPTLQRPVPPLFPLISLISTGRRLYPVPATHYPSSLSLCLYACLPRVYPTVSYAVLSPSRTDCHALILPAFTHSSLALPLCIWPSASGPLHLASASGSPPSIPISSRPSCHHAFNPPPGHPVRPTVTGPNAAAYFQFEVEKLLCLHISYSKIVAVASG